MHLDIVCDDELHARESHTVIGKKTSLEGDVRIADIDHYMRLRPRQRGEVGTHALDRNAAGVNMTNVALGARDGHLLTGPD